MKHDPELLRINRRLTVLHLALQLWILFIVPLALLPRHPGWGWLLLPGILMTNPWWAYLHESLHGLLFSDKGWNRRIGRLNAILYGAPYDVLRWGHLLHHAYSRSTRERSEVYVAGRDERWRIAVGYYFRLLGGLYLYEVIGGLLLLLPRKSIACMLRNVASADNAFEEMGQRLLEPATLRSVRIDVLAILAVYTAAIIAYGAYAWMLGLVILCRAVLISLVDNAFHYGTRLDDVRFARNLSLPGWLSRLMLHFNLHGTHHLRAHTPWCHLPELHRQSGVGYQAGWVEAVLRQLRGPIAEQALPKRVGAESGWQRNLATSNSLKKNVQRRR